MLKNGIFALVLTASGLLALAQSAPAQAEVCQWRAPSMLFCDSPLNYRIDHDYDANNCEFYVNAFGKAFLYHNGYQARWIPSYVSVDLRSLEAIQRGKVLNVGLYTAGNLFLGTPVPNEPGYYLVGMTFEEHNPYSHGPSQARPLGDFAYFIDVRRESGVVDRLWLKNGSRDFRMFDVYDTYPKHEQSLGTGSIGWVQATSPIYNQKAACAR